MNEKTLLRILIIVLATWQLLECYYDAHLLRETRRQLDCANQQTEKAIGMMEKIQRKKVESSSSFPSDPASASN